MVGARVQHLRWWCGEVKVRGFGGECWRLVIPSAVYRLLLRAPSPARPAGAQLLAKLRKHAENHLLHQAARAQAQGGERAYAPTPTHNPTDPPQPSSTAPKASSYGGTSTTARCCRTRASSSPCRRAAWSPAGARSTAAPAVVWRGKGVGLRRRVLEAGDSVGGLPILAPDAQPSQTSWSSAARKGPKTRRKPPAATSCVKMRELKLKRESE